MGDAAQQWARSEGDQWDIVSSVGYTALGVATLRAVETAKERPLIRDDLARLFVEASGDSTMLRALAEPPHTSGTAFFIDQIAVRTKFFDDFFLRSAYAGANQAVILASGLDSRAYRLPWPVGSRVFEIDQAKVLEFKAGVTEQHGVRPTAGRHEVAVDLRDDWPAALIAAGFEPEKPTAWSAEGLLPYLPGAAQDLLFERVHALSAPGSRFAVEGGLKPGDLQKFHALRSSLMDSSSPFGEVDISQLFYDDERVDPEAWLAEHGWTLSGESVAELAKHGGRSLPELPETLAELFHRRGYLTAVR